MAAKKPAKLPVKGLRSKARVFAPEPFDPGQPVDFKGERGVVWSLGMEQSRSTDSRWVAMEDGSVQLLVVAKERGGLEPLRWGGSAFGPWAVVWPSNPVPFQLSEYLGEPAEQLELAAA